MIPIRKRTEPIELKQYRETDPTATYQALHGAPSSKRDKDGNPIDLYHSVLTALIREQGGICAYCMRRIPEERKRKDMRQFVPCSIEHIIPESRTDEAQRLDYRNMIAVCSGNRNGQNSEKTCDASRGNLDLQLNPLDGSSLSSLYYNSNGKILSSSESIQKELDDVLHLNEKVENGEVVITARGLNGNRRKALTELRKRVSQKTEKRAQLHFCRQCLSAYKGEGNLKSEYVGILIWWLERYIGKLEKSVR